MYLSLFVWLQSQETTNEDSRCTQNSTRNIIVWVWIDPFHYLQTTWFYLQKISCFVVDTTRQNIHESFESCRKTNSCLRTNYYICYVNRAVIFVSKATVCICMCVWHMVCKASTETPWVHRWNDLSGNSVVHCVSIIHCVY